MRMTDTVRTMFVAFERPEARDLNDMGLSADDYAALVRAPQGARERMVFMAERFGVGEGQLNAEHWRAVQMARTCSDCGVHSSCERFRRGQDTGFAPAQCPNAPQFAELAV